MSADWPFYFDESDNDLQERERWAPLWPRIITASMIFPLPQVEGRVVLDPLTVLEIRGWKPVIPVKDLFIQRVEYTGIAGNIWLTVKVNNAFLKGETIQPGVLTGQVPVSGDH